MLLSGLLMSGAGGLLSSLGDKAGEWLGLTPDVRNSRQAQGANVAMGDLQNRIMQASPEYMRNTASSAAGGMGHQAQLMAQRKFGNVGPSASDLIAANRQRQIGQQALSNVGSLFQSSKNTAAQQQGNLQNRAMNTLQMAGAPVAALGATAGSLGQGSMLAAGNLYNRAGSQYNQAYNTAARAGQSASNIILNSRSQSLKEASPYAVNYQNPSALISGLTSAQATGSSMASEQARTNPFAGIGAGLGMAGAGNLSDYLSQLG